MKHLIIILFLTVTSCDFKTKEEVKTTDKTITTAPNIEFNLIDAVLKNLNIKKGNCKTDLIAFKKMPNNPEETILVIPEIVDEGEHYFELNSYILIVNNKTGKIINKYFESFKTNNWVSDAVELREITIDTAPYNVTDNTQAFGIRVRYVGSSHANPYEQETISLFIKEQNVLKQILKNFTVKQHNGFWDTNCAGEFVDEKKALIISKNMTNAYYDILIKNKIILTTNYEDENGNCDYTEKITTVKKVLKFNGKEYKENEIDLSSFNKIINEIKTKTIPLIDSTNFNNLKSTDFYNAKQLKALQVKRIYPKIDNKIKFESTNKDGKPPYTYYMTKEDFKVAASYKIKFSKDFHSIVLTVLKGDHEMESVLINYDLNGGIIDFKIISYDEIAEGAVNKYSKIENNIITIIDEVYFDEKQVDTTKFHINRNGEINQIKTKFSSNLKPEKRILLVSNWGLKPCNFIAEL